MREEVLDIFWRLRAFVAATLQPPTPPLLAAYRIRNTYEESAITFLDQRV